jgi:NNP family nitrate/nitrite transporter-like MFS transporter
MRDQRKAISVLTLNTVAFTVCFACWMMNGVLITYLVENRVFDWDKAQMGTLIGIPVLTGAVTRLPVGVLCDKYGGRIVFFLLMLLAAIPMYLVSHASTYMQFLLAGLGFGLSGASFAVGIAYTSVWFEKKWQGTALGVFGAGNAGAALTSVGAPWLLRWLTDNGTALDGWRTLPKIYAGMLVVMAVLFWAFTYTRKVDLGNRTTILARLQPLKHLQVWRFGLYYFFVFGGFVALAQWLIPYYVNAYTMSVAMAGMMAAIFSFPSGVIRALGGWMSDKWGARTVMYWVLGVSLVACLLLIVPRMIIQSPGQGIMADANGTVELVTAQEIVVSGKSYSLKQKAKHEIIGFEDDGTFVLPRSTGWQEPVVKVGDQVHKKQLLARGITQIFFQANVWIFTFLAFVVGIAMGIGKAAVYKHIPDYFPRDVGVVGGVVGVLGGLGGFVCPIIFGYLLQATGLWTTSWMFFTVLVAACLVWMHLVIRRMLKKHAPGLARQIEDTAGSELGSA